MSNSIAHHIKSDSALFLDRDGVINQRPINDYVRNFDGFVFLPGVLEAIALLKKFFVRIFIVTNQQGVGKRLMTQAELKLIHDKMLNIIELNSGKIDRIYCCTDLKSKENNCRKPNISMALKAKKDFPEINLFHSIMVGDTNSDLLFGKNAGMMTIQIGNEAVEIKPNFQFSSLIELTNSLNDNTLNKNSDR